MLKKGFLILVFLKLTLGFSQEITGSVKNISNDEVVPFSKIFFVDHGTTIISDSIGNWSSSNLPIGENHIIVKATGFKTVHTDVFIHPDSIIVIFLQPLHFELEKVIVSNNGYLHRESITNVESMNMSDINTIENSTLGQSISQIPGVYQTGIGVGIGKPVIRGLSGSSVVTYVNGLRIQNQQWGDDHGLPITSLGIGSVEVIKGPSSLLFGADALGGVLYFVDEYYAEKNSFSGTFSSRVESNSMGVSNQMGIKYAKNNVRLNVYGGYDNFADYQIPGGQQVLNSRFNQSSAKVNFGFARKKWVFDLRYNFYFGRIGLPGHTHDSIADLTSFLTDNQNRGRNVPAQVVQNHFISMENKFFFNNQELFIILGSTNSNLKEHEEKFYFPDIVMNLNNSLFNVKWRNKLSKKFELIMGSQGMYQLNKNGESAPETLVPNSKTTDLGVYSLFRYQFKKIHALAGVRVDYRNIDAAEVGFEEEYVGFNYSAGFAHLGKSSTFRFNVSSGFRAPNTSELLADGIHHGSFRYEIGNINLKTEKATQIDASLAIHLDDFEFIINPFYSYIRDYIFIQEQDSVINNFDVYAFTQASYAQLFGLDVGLHYHPHHAHWLHLESSFSNVFAEDENKNPLPLIPQTRLMNQIKFEVNMPSKFRISDFVIQYNYFFKQNRLSKLETETPDFHIINLGLNMVYGMKNPLIISLGIRNALNSNYIDHLAQLRGLGIPNPGLNVYFSLKYEFNNQLNK